MTKYVIRKTNLGYQFTLESDNNEIIATSKNYETIMECRNDIANVRRNAAEATVETV